LKNSSLRHAEKPGPPTGKEKMAGEINAKRWERICGKLIATTFEREARIGKQKHDKAKANRDRAQSGVSAKPKGKKDTNASNRSPETNKRKRPRGARLNGRKIRRAERGAEEKEKNRISRAIGFGGGGGFGVRNN